MWGWVGKSWAQEEKWDLQRRKKNSITIKSKGGTTYLKISMTFGFRQKWQPHSESDLKKIEVSLSGYKTTPLCTWLVQCSQPQGHSGTPCFPWFGSSVQGLRGQHPCARPWDGRGERIRGRMHTQTVSQGCSLPWGRHRMSFLTSPGPGLSHSGTLRCKAVWAGYHPLWRTICPGKLRGPWPWKKGRVNIRSQFVSYERRRLNIPWQGWEGAPYKCMVKALPLTLWHLTMGLQHLWSLGKCKYHNWYYLIPMRMVISF